MLCRYTSLKEIILKFIQEFDARVTDITMKSESMKVDAAAARKDQETAPGGTTDHDVPCKDKPEVDEDVSHSHPQKKEESGQSITGMDGESTAIRSNVSGTQNVKEMHQDFGNIHIGDVYNFNCEGGTHETSWHCNPAPNKHISQVPRESFRRFGRRIRGLFRATLTRVARGSLIFSFAHSTSEDAINMIIRHAEVKEVILHFLQELDQSIQDIRMKVEFRKLCQPEEQTADTSGSVTVTGMSGGRAIDSRVVGQANTATPSQADRDLHYASKDGDLEKVKRLLSTPGVNVNSRVCSRTPVMAAARWGHRDVVELLVSEGADVSLVDEGGNNILHLACWGGDVETVKYVLSLHVVDIDARNNLGQTAADMARDWGRQPVVELLVSRGAQ
ncbi:E3 ubiquitin-protein ligase mib1-like isoform X2 [Haliotis cracherodii]|uniref:E3 ubiquitin-protein ligase mib1-like isoform X2 n=1 Tax=Haliotis cracherodii TaxID=6455 RepID=UPI0039EBCCCD